MSWSDADSELKPRIEPIAKRSSTRAAWGPQTAASAASGVESSPAAAPRGEEPLSVSAALRRMTNALEGVLDGIWITGEVAEVSLSSLGHLYFSLKDEAALLSCAMFRSALGRGPIFQKGDRIELLGRVDIYAPRGRLQMVGTRWRPAGVGSLYEAFLKLKAKLEAEGLFAPERKKPIPRFVRRIALVTSAQAAAYGDVLRTLERRTPWVKIMHVDSLVQGADAPASLISALIAAQRLPPMSFCWFEAAAPMRICRLLTMRSSLVRSQRSACPSFAEWDMRRTLPSPILQPICGRRRRQLQRSPLGRIEMLG